MSIFGDHFATRTVSWFRKMLRPEAHYVGGGVILVRMRNGMWIYLDGADISVTPAILTKGDWEPWVTRHFLAALTPGGRVVDIGANCGYYAVLAARHVGPTGRVVAIEANPRLAQLTGRSLGLNGALTWTEVICAAAMDKEGDVELGTPGDFLGSSSIFISQEGRNHPVSTIKARGATLDQLLGGDLKVDVIKIDAEGAEPVIWRGAGGVLAANPRLTMFMEFAPSMIAATLPPAEFLGQIRAAGFAIDELTPRGSEDNVSDAALLAKDWAELRLRRPANA